MNQDPDGLTAVRAFFIVPKSRVFCPSAASERHPHVRTARAVKSRKFLAFLPRCGIFAASNPSRLCTMRNLAEMKSGVDFCALFLYFSEIFLALYGKMKLHFRMPAMAALTWNSEATRKFIQSQKPAAISTSRSGLLPFNQVPVDRAGNQYTVAKHATKGRMALSVSAPEKVIAHIRITVWPDSRAVSVRKRMKLSTAASWAQSERGG